MKTVSFNLQFPNPFMVMVLLLCTVTPTVLAQSTPELNRRFVLAQHLEKQGDLEKALILYKELHSSRPVNSVYYTRVRRVLEKLKKYEEWLRYINAGLQKRSNDAVLLGERARAYFLWGREEEARESWDKIIELNPDAENSYRMVAQLQQRVRLYDDAVTTLLLGRERLNNAKVFANELANIYLYRREFRKATKEYMNMVLVNEGYFNMVERLINGFPSDSDVVAVVTDELKKVTMGPSQNVNFRKLLSGFYIKNKEYQKAFDSYLILDSMTRADGTYILNYADQIYRIGAYEYAIDAYRHFLGHYPENSNAVRARMGLARSLEKSIMEAVPPAGAKPAGEPVQLSAPLDPQSSGLSPDQTLKKALGEYETITRIYRHSPEAIEAHYRIGEIKYYRFFDIDGAIAAYERVRALSPRSHLAWKAALNIGDCYLARGDSEKAADYYKLLTAASGKFSPAKLHAQYMLLLNEYYAGNFSTVRESLDLLFAKTPKNSDISNDIAGLILFLDEHVRGDTLPLVRYASAELLVRQGRLSEAETLLKVSRAEAPAHPIADDALFKIAQLQKEMGRYGESVVSMQQLTGRYPQSPLLELAYLEIAKIYEEKLRNDGRAITEYEQFLRSFSNSIYLDDVRERLRRLRLQE